jgi:hypothetical protein
VLSDPRDDWGLAESLEGLSLVTAAEGDAHRAGMLAGAAESLRERIGARPHPFDVALGRPLLAALDQGSWNTGWDEGRAMPLPEVIKVAVRRTLDDSSTMPESPVRDG